jgi:acetyltransferase-like isoleucine patch superfamily enzyme
MMLVRTFIAVCIALLPSPLKVLIYRHLFGYRIGQKTTIGCSLFVGVAGCDIGNDVTIGHFNVFFSVEQVRVGDHGRIGWLNLFRGGKLVELGAYTTILRRNVMNSIIDPDAANPTTPELILGEGVVITTGHWLDFTDQIQVGPHTIIGGRNSSLWTHNRDRTRPILLGHHCYLGSEIRIAPGVQLAACSIVALGSVLLKSVAQTGCVISGNPAIMSRPLEKRDWTLISRKTRRDIPDELAATLLSEPQPSLSEP